MLSLLSTILQWDDHERERAGLQRVGAGVGGVKSPSEKAKRRGSERPGERSAEEEAVINEVKSFETHFSHFLHRVVFSLTMTFNSRSEISSSNSS